MNRKGFTLIELLAVIVILSIIMLVAVPNVISVISKQEKNSYINDATKLITMAKYTMSRDTDINYPPAGGIVILEYGFINDGDISRDSDGYEYKAEKSFVVLSLSSDGYLTYWVQLVSENESNCLGLVSEEDLGKNEAQKLVNNTTRIVNNYNEIFGRVYGSGSATAANTTICSKKGCKKYGE